MLYLTGRGWLDALDILGYNLGMTDSVGKGGKMKKREFTLLMPEAEAEAFTAKCSARGITMTSALRSFVRQYSKFAAADFCVLPVMKVIALGKLAKEARRA